MSLTALLWLLIFLALALGSFFAPSWGASVYMLTFFALPQLWWWGKQGVLWAPRWNLIGGLLFLISVVVTYRAHPLATRLPRLVTMRVLMVLMIANYTFVTLGLAYSFELSTGVLFLQLKFVILIILLDCAMQDAVNFRRVIIAVLCGVLFLGVEINLLGAGKSIKGRLEGVGVPGGVSSNQLANLLVTFLPMAGAAIFSKDKVIRFLGIATSPLALNAILKCNSRGAYLGLIAGGSVMLLLSRGKERRLLMGGALLGAAALVVLVGDEQILGRFKTTFVEEQQRDESASSRIVFWKAALSCLGDHPFGVGGDCYKMILSSRYLGGPSLRNRSIHNGYLNEAVQWGVHALVIRVLLIFLAYRCVGEGRRIFREIGSFDMSLLGLSLVGGLVAFSTSGFFGDYWDSEWGLQMCALCMGYDRIAHLTRNERANQPQSVPIPVGVGPLVMPAWSAPAVGRVHPSMPG
jgi:putative inorganic carbon (HCO3(-)) transporter